MQTESRVVNTKRPMTHWSDKALIWQSGLLMPQYSRLGDILYYLSTMLQKATLTCMCMSQSAILDQKADPTVFKQK